MPILGPLVVEMSKEIPKAGIGPYDVFQVSHHANEPGASRPPVSDEPDDVLGDDAAGFAGRLGGRQRDIPVPLRRLLLGLLGAPSSLFGLCCVLEAIDSRFRARLRVWIWARLGLSVACLPGFRHRRTGDSGFQIQEGFYPSYNQNHVVSKNRH